MPARRIITLADRPWSVRAVHPDAIDLSDSAGAVRDAAKLRDALNQGTPARVPGCVHHALIDAGLIESPDRGDAEERLRWIGKADWEYGCEFEWDGTDPSSENDSSRTELVFNGLDTVAEVTINDRVLGSAASFFFPHRFDVRNAIRPGLNELLVRFTSPLRHIRAEEARLGSRPFNGDGGGWDPFVFIRKPACNLGWDWGPRVATVGIAGGVWIEQWRSARIDTVRPLVMIATAEHAEVVVHASIMLEADRPRVASPTAKVRPVVPLAGGGGIDTLDPQSADNPVLRGEADPCAGGEEPHIIAVLRSPGGGAVVARGRAALAPGSDAVSIRLGVQAPELWWPRGHGPRERGTGDDRPLYELRVELRRGDVVLDTWQGRVGLRTVVLDTSRDRWGSAFTLRVNGTPIFCQGANWIPEGLFAGYAGDDLIRTRIGAAAECGMNMLRVWGGGLYEPAAFYDECDRLGILVWQDFMFACGMYPEEPPFKGGAELVEREARHQIARLSTHASVVLWCGGNETVWGHDKWGWKERLKEGQTWGKGYWLEMLPRLCAEIDPTRPYWPNSPWSGEDADGKQRDVLDADHGDRHTWEVEAWGPRPEVEGFRSPNASGVPRFCSESGHQSPSCFATFCDQLSGIGLPPDVRAQPSTRRAFVAHSGDDTRRKTGATFSQELARRQRGPGGDERWYDAPLAAEFGPPGSPLRERDDASEASFTRWMYLAQVLQARAVARGIEWHRVNRPRCGGVLFWQLNDCWAGHSWSAVDAAGRRKPLWYATRRAMSPRLLSIHAVDGVPMLFGVNDTDKGWEGEIVSRRIGFDGVMLAEHRGHVRIGPRVAGSLWNMECLLGRASDVTRELLIAEAREGGGEAAGQPGFERALFFHRPDHELAYPRGVCDVRVSVTSEGVRLSLVARTLIRDYVLAPDQVDSAATASDNLITLLPGEEAVIDVRTAIEASQAWRSAPAPQWVNRSSP